MKNIEQTINACHEALDEIARLSQEMGLYPKKEQNPQWRVRVSYMDVYVRAKNEEDAVAYVRDWIADQGGAIVMLDHTDNPVIEFRAILDQWWDTYPEVTPAD